MTSLPTKDLPLQIDALPKFQQAQFAFTAHVRDPVAMPCPVGVDDRRMAIYRDLFFNNVEGFISNCFPVLRSMVADEAWRALVRDFYARHISHSPLFSEIPAEFLSYLEKEKSAELAPSFPFLIELAHYEWLELAAQIAVEDLPLALDAALTAESQIALSPLAFVQAYQFPVSKIGPSFQPETAPAEPTLVVVYRNRSDKVHFLALNPLSYQLLQLLGENHGQRAGDILTRLATSLNLPPEKLSGAGLVALRDFVQRDIVLMLP